jgi:vacuolar-type H+-ATPase subunit F/Vma7
LSQMAIDRPNTAIAIIAERYLATGFTFAGITAFPAGDAEEAASEFERIVAEDKFDVIMITEKLSEQLKKQRAAIVARGKARPIIAIVPDFGGPTGERLRELHTLISQSVGAELKFKS